MEIVVLIIYTAIFSGLILKSKLFEKKNIPRYYLLGFFLIKAVLGIVYGILFQKHLNGKDTFVYFNESKIIFNTFKDNPLYYLQLTFGVNDYRPEPPHLLPYIDAMNFWYDQGNYFMVRLNSIFQLFSFGYYNVHALFISFMSFIGVFNIFNFLSEQHQKLSKYYLFAIFLIPSFLFWPSGLHKEAVVTFAIGLILNGVIKLEKKQFNITTLLMLGIGFGSLALVRFYVFILITPALVAFYLSKTYKPIYAFASVYFISFSTIFTLQKIFPSINFLNELIIRQRSFIRLVGNTTFPMDPLEPTWGDLFSNLPWAIINPFIRPLPFECDKLLCMLSSIETWVLLLGFILFLIFIDVRKMANSRIALFSLFFSFSIMVIIGLLVNNSGAIVRYRSFVLPFLIIGFSLSSKIPKMSIGLMRSFFSKKHLVSKN